LSRREGARTAILYAFDLIAHDGEDMHNRPFLDRKAALARLLRNIESGILFNEHITEDGPVVFHACQLGANIGSKKVEYLSIRSMPGLDQAPQSRQHRGAEGAERDLESTSLEQPAPAVR
jgi:hypothetical protein